MKQERFSVGEAAKLVRMTSETLRHYDRIGLVKPSHRDDMTKYRCYTQQDIVRLNTVHALQQMGISLQEIKQVLDYDDLEAILAFLDGAEQKADEKMAALQYAKSKIQLARADYEKKRQGWEMIEGAFVQNLPKRVIMRSDTLETPTLDNLWSYLHHYYEKIPPSRKEQFLFEDMAGIYTERGLSRLFAVCVRYAEIDGLTVLPKGNYLCAYCTDEDRADIMNALIETAKVQYGVIPKFTVQMIVLSGILRWSYQIQIPIEL